jgi:hypothetical protein
MSRLSLALINQLFETLRILLLDFNEIKNRQPTSGRSGVLGYLSQTNDTWDKTETLSSPALNYGLSAEFEITYVADGSQNYPIVNPFAEVLFSSAIQPTPTKAEYHPQSGFLQWTDGTNSAQFNAFLDPVTGNAASANTYKWRVSFSYFGTITYFLKAFTRGTSRGTITVVRTY